MLATIKKLMKSWFAAVLLGLVMISTAFLGQRMDVFGAIAGNTGTWIVKAGKQETSAKEFAAFFERVRKQQEQQNGRAVSVEDAIRGGLEKQALNELMTSESMSVMIKNLGIVAPPAVVDDAMKQQLSQYPQLFDEITGELNMQALNSLLEDNGLDYATYRKGLEGQIIDAQFYGSLTAGFTSPRLYSALNATYMMEERDLDYFLITPQSVGPILAPTDAEMQAFLQKNAAQVMLPEMRVIKLVRFNAEAFQATLKADPAEVQKRFDFRKDSLSSPEVRSFIQIPVKNAGQVASVAERLKKGDDPNAIAKSVGGTAVISDDKPKSALFEKTVAEAVFGLPVGGVSGALKGELGQSVVKVTKITPAKVATLEEHRADIEKDVIKSAAANKAYEQAQAFDKLHSEGATFEQAAAKVGATVLTPPAITPDGRGIDPAHPVDPRIVTKEVAETAFSLPAGSDSTLIEVTAGDQFFVRVEKIIPPAPPPLDLVRKELSQMIINQKTAQALQARAKELSDRARKGESMAAVAASRGYKLVQVPKITRQSARQHAALGLDVLNTVFEGSTGQVFVAPVRGDEKGQGAGLAVGKIGGIRPGAVPEIAQITEQGRQSFARNMFQDIDVDARNWARDKIKPKSDRDRAITALGEDPAKYAEKKDDKSKGPNGKAGDAKSK